MFQRNYLEQFILIIHDRISIIFKDLALDKTFPSLGADFLQLASNARDQTVIMQTGGGTTLLIIHQYVATDCQYQEQCTKTNKSINEQYRST